MIEILTLVCGAVSTKDIEPTLTHLCVYNGRVQGFNGRVAVDAACPDLVGIDAVIPAQRFLKAVMACDGNPTLKVNDDKSKLRISRNRFRATVPLLGAESYPRELPPTASPTPLPAPLLPVLRRLQPFVSSDASRPWSCSILLTKGRAIATNNVVLACVPYPWDLPDLVLPDVGVQELLRLKEEPQGFVADGNSFYAFYGSTWLKSQLLQDSWPTVLQELLNKIAPTDELFELPGTLLEDIALLTPFFPDAKLPIILTGPDGVSTQDGLHSAAVDGINLPVGAFRLESLSLVLGEATHADLSRQPSPWRGNDISGLISGVRVATRP